MAFGPNPGPLVQQRGARPYRVGRTYPLVCAYVGKNNPTLATNDHVFDPTSIYGNGVAWTSVFLPVEGFMDWWAAEADAQQIVHGVHDWGRLYALCTSNAKNVGAVNLYSRINGKRGRQVGTFASGSVFGSIGLTDSGLYDRVVEGDKICWEMEFTGSGFLGMNQIASRFIDRLRIGDHDGDHTVSASAPSSWRNASGNGYGLVLSHTGATDLAGPIAPGGWMGSFTEADFRFQTNMPGGYTNRGYASSFNANSLATAILTTGVLNAGAATRSEIVVPPGFTGWVEQFGNDWIAPANGISGGLHASAVDGTNWWAQAELVYTFNGQDKMLLAFIDDRAGGGATNIVLNKTLQMPVYGQATPANLGNSSGIVQSPFPAGILRNLFVKAQTNNFTAASVTLTVYVNGVATALTVTRDSSAPTTLIADTTHTVQIANNDLVSVQFVSGSSGGGAFGPAMYGFGFHPL